LTIDLFSVVTNKNNFKRFFYVLNFIDEIRSKKRYNLFPFFYLAIKLRDDFTFSTLIKYCGIN